MKFDRELLKGNVAVLLLSLLREKPMYGYQIIKQIDSRTNNVFEFKEGTLYPALHSLEKKGYLTSNWVATDDGRDRKYYFITKKGERYAQAKLEEWNQFSWAVNAVLGMSNA